MNGSFLPILFPCSHCKTTCSHGGVGTNLFIYINRLSVFFEFVPSVPTKKQQHPEETLLRVHSFLQCS